MYSILVELEGFQPVRLRGVVVVSGSTTWVSVVLSERPPPVTSVTTLDHAGLSTGAQGRVLAGGGLERLGERSEATGILRDQTNVVAALDGRPGAAVSGGGLVPALGRFTVDGLPEQVLRHPGMPGEPGVAPLWLRRGLVEAHLVGGSAETDRRGASGSTMILQSRPGGSRLRFSPWVEGSTASLGGRAADNPADSAATAFEIGAALEGPIKPDTISFQLLGNYRSLLLPSANGWEGDSTVFQGGLVSLRERLPVILTNVYGTTVPGGTAPAVRSWKGGTGLARVDWRLGPSTSLMIRGALASWKEANPLLGPGGGTDAGGDLSARDLSLGAVFVTAGGTTSNEALAGFTASRRDWTRRGIASTLLVGDAVRLGAEAVLPAKFDVKTFTVLDAIQYASGRHTVKGGFSLDYSRYQQRYVYGESGIFAFGNLDQFRNATGTYYRATPGTPEVSFDFFRPAFFLQDAFQVSGGLSLMAGLRWDTELLPQRQVRRPVHWEAETGQPVDTLFQERRGWQPRVGFILNPGSRGTLIVQGSIGLYSGTLDPAVYAEAISHSSSDSSGVVVDRWVGVLPGWPNLPVGALKAPRLTLLRGASAYHVPRTLKSELSVDGALGGGIVLRVGGAYHHTDFLLRRTDLNRGAYPTEITQEGRPVYGILVSTGGMVIPEVSSGRRYQQFDMVSSLAPTGFSDYYELGASIERRRTRGLSAEVAYTWSRTRDNMIGLLATDPADQLDPFPDGLEGVDWSIGRSDVDVPHRVTAMVAWTMGQRMPLTVGARARWRSGLPFTPGFRRGVDINGDLSGGNDPVTSEAAVIPSTPGVLAGCDGTSTGAFAARNSCRDRGTGSVDVHVALGLPVLGAGRLALSVDAFNVLATQGGVVDHAALLIDPSRPLTSSNGSVTVPLVVNPRFGSLLARRADPRLIRLGLRVEY